MLPVPPEDPRIGQIDRIRYPTFHIHNFYYHGTVEAKVYRRLRDRIEALFTSSVTLNIGVIFAWNR